jgi:hypothetical protein
VVDVPGLPAALGGLVEDKADPDMGEGFQPAYRVGVIEWRQQLDLDVGSGASAGWRGMPNFSL